MMSRKIMILAASASLILLQACSNNKIYETDSFCWRQDGISQKSGHIKATAPDACTLVSNYPEAEYESGEWKLSADISAYPQYSAPTRFEEAIYNMSVEESIKAVEPDSTLRTGKSWGGVWTRDVSYSTILSMSYTQTQAAKYSLMRKVDDLGRIIQDTGTGGSWPCSSDRTIWAAAAWEIYKVTGDRDWLEYIYPVVKRSVEDDILTVYDNNTGMMKGESSFLDWREQEYPLWMNPVDIFNSENLGTECDHYQTFRILAQMERMLGSEEDAARYDKFADGIREGMNKYLWMEDKGYYAQYLYGRQNLIASPRSETLGEALAIRFGIADPEQAVRICANMANQSYGTACFFPNIKDIPPYHNDAMWPFVQSYWMKACAIAGNEKGVLHSIACIYRAASMYLTNKENMVIYDGRWQGTQINSSNMLWSLSGNLSIVYSILFGIDFETDRIVFNPFVPQKMAGTRSLKGYKYRNADLDITVTGYGNGIASFTLDGEECTAEIPCDITGHHDIDIVLNGKHNDSEITIVDNAYSPATPVCIISDGVLNWDKVDGASTYKIIRNGMETAGTSECFFKPESDGQYQVIAVADDGYESFASEPVDIVGKMIVTDMEKSGTASTAPYTNYDGEGYLNLSLDENTKVTVPVDVDEDGVYAIDFLYANANGPINTNNRCCIRTLWDNGVRMGVVVMPQCGDGEYNIWKYSNVIVATLSAGRHEFSLTFEPENTNMNIEVNSAAVDKIRLIRK